LARCAVPRAPVSYGARRRACSARWRRSTNGRPEPGTRSGRR
jgi:hypothetical protein